MCKVLKNRLISFRVGNKKIIWPGELFSSGREVFCDNVYFLVPCFEVKEGDVVIDLGAGVGDFSTICAIKGARVISVEAQLDVIKIAKENLLLNNVSDKVTVVPGIVGGRQVYLSGQKLSEFSGVPIIDINELIKKFNLERISLCKMDIEGSEFDVIRGDIGWVDRVDRVVMEVHLQYGELEELLSTFARKGFKCFVLNKRFRIVPDLDGPIGFLFAKRVSGEGSVA